ncbi:MAG TPA: HEAT repeat domain-containing protein, partial [Candidatus Dormibacteraeota bacterium]|nr:HEAT repeat domain-containing protein [Candidatus Dormibacteraeota bacterium]
MRRQVGDYESQPSDFFEKRLASKKGESLCRTGAWPSLCVTSNRCMLSSWLYGLRLRLSSLWNHLRLNSSDSLVRSKALDSLSGSTNSLDTERVFASLHDKSPQVRCVALRALANRSGHPETLKSLASALSDRSAEVREAAARVLGQFRNANAAGALVTCLKDPEPSVRSAAASALRATGWRPSTHEQAAWFDVALGNTPDPLSAPTEAESSGESTTHFHRRMEAERLKERNNPARISALLVSAHGGDLLARTSALHDLGEVTSPIVGTELPKFLRDPEPEVRLAAAQALVQRDDALPAHFVGLLHDSDPNLRLVAVRFFTRIPNQQITRILLPLLSDSVANIRQATATTVGFEGNSAAIEDLVLALMDEDPQVCRAAQESLV